MSVIRPMREEDVDAIRRVDATAFGVWWRQLKGGEDELPRRTRANVLALREKDPAGCFVAEEDGRVVGLIFSRTWGSVGWFGTFAVLPDYQGRGIGKRLIAASLDYLRREPERVIGLSTMPESPYNLGLYLKQGFQVRFLTLMLTKTLEEALEQPAPHAADLPRWSEVDVQMRDRWLADLREAAGQIHPGLDYTKEIASTARHRFGQTLVLIRDARAVGMSIVHLRGIREGLGDESATVRALMLHPAHTNAEALGALLEASESLARIQGKQKITLAVNARHVWALERVLRFGYRAERAGLRMILAGTDAGPSIDDHVNLARWAG